MSETIKLDQVHGSEDYENLRWGMCEIMASKDGTLTPWKEHFNYQNSKFCHFEVEMKIDGVEVKFSTILKHMFDQYDAQVKAKALDLIGDKFYNVEVKFREMFENLKEEFGVNRN